MAVRALPPSESESSFVRVELRYGICLSDLDSVSAEMTLPSCDSDW